MTRHITAIVGVDGQVLDVDNGMPPGDAIVLQVGDKRITANASAAAVPAARGRIHPSKDLNMNAKKTTEAPDAEQTGFASGMILVEKYAVGDRVTEERVTRLGQSLVQAGWKIQHHDQGTLDDGKPARCLWMWKEPTAAEVQP